MRLKLTIIMLVLLASLFTSPYLNNLSISKADRCVLVHALAVREEGRGKVVPLKICIETSPIERITIYSHSIVAEDVIASFIISTLITKLELGHYKNYSISIEILSNESAKGPSAGALIAVALASLIGKKPIGGSITGFINIDGGIDAIGGLMSKIKVAIESNITRVAVPVFNYLESIYELKLLPGNVTIRPVASIINSYEFLTREKIIVNYTTLTRNPIIDESLNNISSDLERLAREVLNELRNESNVDISKINKYLNYAETFRKMGKVYTAASMAFISYMKALSTLCNVRGLDYAKNLERKAKSIINETLDFLKNYRIDTDISVVLGIEVLRRIADANRMLSEAEKVSSAREICNITAYAYARALSAQEWLYTLKNVLQTSIGKAIKSSSWILELERLANYTLDSISEVIAPQELEIPSILQEIPKGKELLWKAALARYIIDTTSSMIRASSSRSAERSLPYLKDKLLKIFIVNVSRGIELRLSELQNMGADVTIPMLYLEYSNAVIDIGLHEAALSALIHAAGVTLTLELMYGLIHMPEVELKFEQSQIPGEFIAKEMKIPMTILLTAVLIGEAICSIYLIVIFSRR